MRLGMQPLWTGSSACVSQIDCMLQVCRKIDDASTLSERRRLVIEKMCRHTKNSVAFIDSLLKVSAHGLHRGSVVATGGVRVSAGGQVRFGSVTARLSGQVWEQALKQRRAAFTAPAILLGPCACHAACRHPTHPKPPDSDDPSAAGSWHEHAPLACCSSSTRLYGVLDELEQLGGDA